jgi:hypothetical protein
MSQELIFRISVKLPNGEIQTKEIKGHTEEQIRAKISLSKMTLLSIEDLTPAQEDQSLESIFENPTALEPIVPAKTPTSKFDSLNISDESPLAPPPPPPPPKPSSFPPILKPILGMVILLIVIGSFFGFKEWKRVAVIEQSSIMNGRGEGTSTFTNVDTKEGNLCGYIIVAQKNPSYPENSPEEYIGSREMSGTFCSGLIQPKSTVKIEFTIPKVKDICLERRFAKYGWSEWMDACDLYFHASNTISE